MSRSSESRSTNRWIFDTEVLVSGEDGFETEASTTSPSVFTKTLFSARGKECGSFTWYLFNTLEEQGRRFGDYMGRIPFSDKWPVALFENLAIQHRFRRRGLGRKGVKQFIQDAIEHGAVCSILKVGWSTDDWERERDWKMKFYASEGFIELERLSPYEPYVMYRQLKSP